LSSQIVAPLPDDWSNVLRDRWDEHADQWISWVRDPSGPDSYERFHRKHFLSLVPAPGRLTLDIGCGEGRVGRDLLKVGHTVVGVDWSDTMCKAAATHPETPISAIGGDANKLPLADASVDCAIAFMSLQTIDDMPGALTEIARVLEDGKKLTLAIVHPMYSGGRFFKTGDSSVDFVIEQSYFESGNRVRRSGRNGKEVIIHGRHRPLQAYVTALIRVGFSIEELHEVTEEDQDDPRHRIPMFLDILATRGPRDKKMALA
jgi:SAM-dependent methyltransferase